jgi:hypothetical protein
MVKFGRANQQQAQIVIVQNWLAELKTRVAAQ